MNILNTKIGKILSFDLTDYLVDKTVLMMTKIEDNKRQRTRLKLIEFKKSNGLTDEERLCPADSNCNHDFIKNVEVVSRNPGVNSIGEKCTVIKQKVTYIDESVKEFTIHMTLSSFIPDNFEDIYQRYCEDKNKVKKLT